MFKEVLEPWYTLLKDEFESEYFRDLLQFIELESKQYIIYPPRNEIFNALNKCNFDRLKVVIIGQDPYHGAGQANGLAFSVSDGIKHPPSLINIFKEISNDLGCEIPLSGNLERWAKQGVLLLNATLTVRAGTPGSHQNKGWEIFTNAVIKTLSAQKQELVFILWGAFAQKMEILIDSDKHLVLKSAHPSPFSANRGFFGNKHFSQTNRFLSERGKSEIIW